MDSRSAAVITAAIEEQRAQEAAQQAQEAQSSKQTGANSELVSEEQHRELQQLAQQHQAHQEAEKQRAAQGDNQNQEDQQQQHQFQVIQQQLNNHLKSEEPEKKILPRKSTQRPFAVDPELNVAVGIVQDIVGPRVNHNQEPLSQQQREEQQQYEPNPELPETPQCSRCKKDFTPSLDGKTYKLCPHCRELQRQRSRRWQQRIKQKEGACKRCGVDIPQDQSTYVLCPPCRFNLRTRKATRYENGKCVHCSGINDSTEFKVCTRCRNNDKMRRKNLEDRGCCNRCANPLKVEDENHKVCNGCRSRKKNIAKSHQNGPQLDSPVTNSNDPNINYQQQFAQQAQQLEANLFAQ